MSRKCQKVDFCRASHETILTVWIVGLFINMSDFLSRQEVRRFQRVCCAKTEQAPSRSKITRVFFLVDDGWIGGINGEPSMKASLSPPIHQFNVGFVAQPKNTKEVISFDVLIFSLIYQQHTQMYIGPAGPSQGGTRF